MLDSFHHHLPLPWVQADLATCSKEQNGTKQKEEKKKNFPMDKPGKHYPGQVIKENITSDILLSCTP